MVAADDGGQDAGDDRAPTARARGRSRRRLRTAGSRGRRRGQKCTIAAVSSVGSMRPAAFDRVDHGRRGGGARSARRSRSTAATSGSRRAATKASSRSGLDRVDGRRVTRCEPTVARMSVTRPSKRVLGEQLVELVAGAALDGLGQELGLAGEAAVDGAGGEAGPSGDLLRRRPRRSPARRTPRPRR